MKIIRKLKDKFAFFKGLLRNDLTIFQMGKVGSRTVVDTLAEDYEIEASYFHVMSSGEFYLSNTQSNCLRHLPRLEKNFFHKWYIILNRLFIRFVYKHLTLRKPQKVITIVREPIGRNISYFFQDIKFYLFVYEKLESNVADVPFRDLFLYCFLRIQNQDFPIRYFEEEFEPIYGLDVLDYPFDKEAGYGTVRSGSLEILVMRLDKLSGLAPVIGEFLGIENFKLKDRNVGSQKWYNSLYNEVKKDFPFPEDYVEKMLGSRFSRHFFTEEELARLGKKYLAEPAAD